MKLKIYHYYVSCYIEFTVIPNCLQSKDTDLGTEPFHSKSTLFLLALCFNNCLSSLFSRSVCSSFLSFLIPVQFFTSPTTLSPVSLAFESKSGIIKANLDIVRVVGSVKASSIVK